MHEHINTDLAFNLPFNAKLCNLTLNLYAPGRLRHGQISKGHGKHTISKPTYVNLLEKNVQELKPPRKTDLRTCTWIMAQMNYHVRAVFH